jgi:outer membrane receptor protein involved in Fe transport
VEEAMIPNGRTARILLIAFLLGGLWSGESLLRSQANVTASIGGYVLDDSGNFIPGASIILLSPALNTRREMISSSEGRFLFAALPVGTYTLRVHIIGYPPYEMQEIKLNPAENRVFDVTLQHGLQEKVIVVAEKSLLDTAVTSDKNVLDAGYINNLPLIARRYQQILTLFPGVGNDEGFTLAQYHIRGSRVTQNGFRLDGASINDQVTGTFGLNVNQNSIERFELDRGGFQAEYGEQTGGIANIITKSGTNDFQFFYSGFVRMDDFGSDIPNYDQVVAAGDSDGITSNNNNPRPETQQWQEFSAGGPIVKDKAWYFTSFQYWQEDIGSIFNDSVRQGDRFNFQFKTTWQINPDNTLIFNLATDPARFKNSITDARYADGTNYNQTQGGFFFQARDTHIFSAKAFLESQLYFHHQYLTARPVDPSLGAFVIGLSDGDASDGIGGTSTAQSFSGAYPNDQDRSTLRSRVSEAVTFKAAKSHTIKTGLDYSFLDFTGINRSRPTYLDITDYDPNFETGGPYYGYREFIKYDYLAPEKTNRKDREAAVFAQDTWTPDGRWTVDTGLRMDYQSFVGDKNLAPRVGVSWDPKGKGRTKIYGNWGRFYDNVFTDFVDFARSDGYQTTYVIADDVNNPGYYYQSAPVYVYDYVIDGPLKSPHRDSYTLGVEQALPWDLSIGLSHTRWRGKDQLRTTLTTDLTGLNVDPAATGAVVFDSKGSSRYRGTELVVRKAFSHNFEMLASYTRSRVEGDTAEDFGFEKRQDARSLDFTRLRYDRPDILNLSAFWRLPASLDLTVINRYQSGALFSPTVFVSGTGIVIDSAQGKNSRRQPPLRSLDLSLSRSFTAGRGQIRITGQVFNLLNNLNVTTVDTFGSSAGRPVDVDFGRIFQAGVEVRF